MAKPRHCGTCGQTHLPPTGKKCQHDEAPHTTDEKLDKMMSLMSGLQGSIDSMDARLEKVEGNGETEGETESETEHQEEDKGSEDTEEEQREKVVKDLQTDKQIQAAVKQRLRELQLASDDDEDLSDDGAGGGAAAFISKRGKKSGRARTANERIKKEVDWPHFHIYRGSDMEPAKYGDLTVQEFVNGFLASRKYCDETLATRERMLEHLQEMMQDAADYPWANVRNYHGIVLHQFEMGRLTWADRGRIQQLRRMYAQTTRGSHLDGASGTATIGQTTGPLFCLSYQRGGCRYNSDHDTSRGNVRHICAFCFKQTGNAYGHGEMDCKRKQKAEQPSKNETEGQQI